ncbi:hypothetical protein OROGR_031575 [Orobanche gracilis]
MPPDCRSQKRPRMPDHSPVTMNANSSGDPVLPPPSPHLKESVSASYVEKIQEDVKFNESQFPEDSNHIKILNPDESMPFKQVIIEEELITTLESPWRNAIIIKIMGKSCFLAIRKWEPNFRADIYKIDYAITWVRVLNLPMELFDRSVILALAKCIGDPIKIDGNTFNASRGKFARFCVQVRTDMPLELGLCINKKVYQVVYENISSLCHLCGKVGHVKAKCVVLHKEDDSNSSLPNKSTPPPGFESHRSDPDWLTSKAWSGEYGDWMLVNRKKKSPPADYGQGRKSEKEKVDNTRKVPKNLPPTKYTAVPKDGKKHSGGKAPEKSNLQHVEPLIFGTTPNSTNSGKRILPNSFSRKNRNNSSGTKTNSKNTTDEARKDASFTFQPDQFPNIEIDSLQRKEKAKVPQIPVENSFSALDQKDDYPEDPEFFDFQNGSLSMGRGDNVGKYGDDCIMEHSGHELRPANDGSRQNLKDITNRATRETYTNCSNPTNRLESDGGSSLQGMGSKSLNVLIKDCNVGRRPLAPPQDSELTTPPGDSIMEGGWNTDQLLRFRFFFSIHQ